MNISYSGNFLSNYILLNVTETIELAPVMPCKTDNKIPSICCYSSSFCAYICIEGEELFYLGLRLVATVLYARKNGHNEKTEPEDLRHLCTKVNWETGNFYLRD